MNGLVRLRSYCYVNLEYSIPSGSMRQNLEMHSMFHSKVVVYCEPR